MLTSARQRGDTIIEVLFAVAVFSLVAISAMTIMNLGTAAAQRALEITLVRQQIDAQADTIRYIHQAYITNRSPSNPATVQWKAMTIDHKRTEASAFGEGTTATCPLTMPDLSFIMDAHKAVIANGASGKPQSISETGGDVTPPPYSQVRYSDDGVFQDSYGIWVEAVPTDKSAVGGVGYVDFHIRACWESPGSGVAMTLGTIVRLYEPVY